MGKGAFLKNWQDLKNKTLDEIRCVFKHALAGSNDL